MTIELKDIDVNHPDVLCALVQFQHADYVVQETLFNALEAQGIPKEVWPHSPTPHVCLGRAVDEAAGRKDRVESIKDGWSLTTVHNEKLDLENPDNDGKSAHEVCVTAKVVKTGDVQELRITPTDSPHAALIRHEYERQQGLFRAAEDLSQWLSRVIIPWVGGVAAKARGGSYYVMKGEGLTNIMKIKKALDSISTFDVKHFPILNKPGESISLPIVTHGTMLTVKPEFATMDAVRIVINGIIEDTDRLCDDLSEKLTDGDLKAKGLKTQINRAVNLENRLSEYSRVLGTDLSDLNGRLSELKNGLGMALAATVEL
jgi:hypothetical protein